MSGYEPRRKPRTSTAVDAVRDVPAINNVGRMMGTPNFDAIDNFRQGAHAPGGAPGIARVIGAANGVATVVEGGARVANAGEQDHLEQYEGSEQMLRGGAGVVAAAGSGPAAVLGTTYATASGVANRGQGFAKEHTGSNWSDIASETTFQAGEGIRQLTGSDEMGAITSGLVLPVAALAASGAATVTGLLGLGEDVVEGVLSTPGHLADLADAAKDSQGRTLACSNNPWARDVEPEEGGFVGPIPDMFGTAPASAPPSEDQEQMILNFLDRTP
jgi:hypothetical protein